MWVLRIFWGGQETRRGLDAGTRCVMLECIFHVRASALTLSQLKSCYGPWRESSVAALRPGSPGEADGNAIWLIKVITTNPAGILQAGIKY